MKKKDNIFALSVLFILFFQWWSRYSGAPVVDFTIDDWKLWKIASSCNSLKEAFMQALNWPDRPIGTGIMISTFYLLDDFILGYVVLESLYTALFLLGGMCIVHALTQDRLVVIIFGLVFSLLPNLTETFQFHTMTISYGLGFAAYMWSCYLWVLYLRNKRFSMLLYAGLSYGFALGSYEAGLFLPAAWLLLGTGRNRRQIISGIFVFGSAALFYLFWKFTDGVGLVETRLFPSRGFNPDWAGYIWNAKEIVRWWTGSRMLECIANGLNGFLTLSPFAMRLLAFINIIIIITTVVVVNATRKVSGNAFSPYSKKRLVVFCLSWVAVTNMLAVLSWPCGRLNYLPAAGVAFLLALVCRQLMDKRISIG
ncbi:MAG: hypothetical protein EOM12_04375, partial [Verrucomicrobiae bacterium]|nr:hypothetical protein [Verrucomicrobiae bacterium]